MFKKNNFALLLLLPTLLLSTYITCQEDDFDDFIELPFEPIARRSLGDTHGSHPNIPAPEELQRRSIGKATSTNWAGYVGQSKKTPANGSVTSVSGTWIAPTIQRSSSANTYSAFWVGIDGYTSSSVEQIGTSHDITNGTATSYAWFEMYPNPSYSFNFPMSPGDVISASVVYSGNGVFRLSIKNNTKKVVVTVPTSYTTSRSALRSCAEWIVEAPYLNAILPLANFGVGQFKYYLDTLVNVYDCHATIDGKSALLQNNYWNCIAIDMVTTTGAKKATTSALTNNSAFTVSWLHE